MKVSDVFQFQRQYSEYYHVLESDFCDTERYLYIDPDNFGSFSSEFIKLIQAICSEIDVTLKFLCTCINQNLRALHCLNIVNVFWTVILFFQMRM